MFTVMISRSYLLVALLGFALAFGAGWAVYELRFGQTVDAPTSATSVSAPKQAIGEEDIPARLVQKAPTSPPDVASTRDQGAVDKPDPEAASQANRLQA